MVILPHSDSIKRYSRIRWLSIWSFSMHSVVGFTLEKAPKGRVKKMSSWWWVIYHIYCIYIDSVHTYILIYTGLWDLGQEEQYGSKHRKGNDAA